MRLTLLQPTDLPVHRRDLPAPAATVVLANSIAVGAPAGDLLDRLRVLPPLARPSDPTPTPAAHTGTGDIAYTYDQRLREYDDFFGVVRVAGPVDDVFSHSLLRAYRSLLEEGMSSGTRMSWADWSALCGALQAMIIRSAGVDRDAGPLVMSEPPMLRGQIDPFRRWRVGHHVFFVLTQCLIVALNSFRLHLAAGRPEEAGHGLRLAGRLLGASAAALVFTSEFSARQYATGVRPSMEPPFAADGFSGLLSPDHHYLVKLFVRIRPMLGELPRELVADHNAFTRSLESVYEAHKYVCRRFGGDAGPSLRTSESTELSAVEVLDRFKLARTKSVRRP